MIYISLACALLLIIWKILLNHAKVVTWQCKVAKDLALDQKWSLSHLQLCATSS